MNLRDQFESFQKKSNLVAPWNQVRRNGFNYFEKAGLPSKKLEDWKYTSLQGLQHEQLLPPLVRTPMATGDLHEKLSGYLSKSFFNLVFVNGELSARLSDLDVLNRKYWRISSLGELLEQRTMNVVKTIRQRRKKSPQLRQDSMEALNSGFARDGIVIDVPAESSLEKPLQILFYNEQAGAFYPKVLICVGERAKLALVESHVSHGAQHLTSAVSEIVVKDSASLEYVHLQDEAQDVTSIARTRIFLDANANLECLSYAVGAKVARHNLDIHCLGQGATAKSYGLTMANGDQHIDHMTLIEHVVGNCVTEQLYKSVVDDRSAAIFRGGVYIHQGADKASSEQLNHNLILSAKAEVDSIPQLDIYADDVKATHGSTVGQLNADEIFYLQSRAITRGKAIEMLSLGFVNDLVDRMSDLEVRSWLRSHLLRVYQEKRGQG
ncbi:MAG: Fe-S cluster assembly protein SufD [Bdellovibrio sp. CG10_big_fil_rev_8_21_14_0_10_47_8]|nr:MAG: Fe-S cluster assembly protein SufD [Bdellovibrio sp. CG10_big_fil_rev_8_21_14_0_10_47_8]